MIPSPGLERPSPTALARVRRALLDAVGGEAVIDDPERFGPYSEDASFGGVHPPDLVVRAGSVEDVQAVLRLASEHRVPVTPRGLGTGNPAAPCRSAVASCSRWSG